MLHMPRASLHVQLRSTDLRARLRRSRPLLPAPRGTARRAGTPPRHPVRHAQIRDDAAFAARSMVEQSGLAAQSAAPPARPAPAALTLPALSAALPLRTAPAAVALPALPVRSPQRPAPLTTALCLRPPCQRRCSLRGAPAAAWTAPLSDRGCSQARQAAAPGAASLSRLNGGRFVSAAHQKTTEFNALTTRCEALRARTASARVDAAQGLRAAGHPPEAVHAGARRAAELCVGRGGATPPPPPPWLAAAARAGDPAAWP